VEPPEQLGVENAQVGELHSAANANADTHGAHGSVDEVEGPPLLILSTVRIVEPISQLGGDVGGEGRRQLAPQ
jgi:hypothetical protein